MFLPSRLVVPMGARAPFRPRPAPRGTHRVADADLGVATSSALLNEGLTHAQIRTAVRRGHLRSIAPGWYAKTGANPKVVKALTAGARLTCVDAAALHGLWVPPRERDDDLHIYRPRLGSACPRWAAAHGSGLRAWPETDAIASLRLTLAHAIRCVDGESAAVLLESAIEKGLLSIAQVQALLDDAPRRHRQRIGGISAASGSGSETRVVRALRRRGHDVEQQVYVEGVGFVDAYVSGLFLEIDGRTHHSSPESFNEDRRRDLAMRRHGLQILRLSYSQVWHSWRSTEEALLETVAQVGRQGRRRVAQLLAA